MSCDDWGCKIWVAPRRPAGGADGHQPSRHALRGCANGGGGVSAVCEPDHGVGLLTAYDKGPNFRETYYLQLSIWPATLIAFAVGFVFRVAALWFAWEEPLPKHISAHVVGEVSKRDSLREKMQPGWEEPGL